MKTPKTFFGKTVFYPVAGLVAFGATRAISLLLSEATHLAVDSIHPVVVSLAICALAVAFALYKIKGIKKQKRTNIHEAGHAVAIHCLNTGEITRAVVESSGKGWVTHRNKMPPDMSSAEYCWKLLQVYVAGQSALEVAGSEKSEEGTAADNQTARDLAVIILARSIDAEELDYLLCHPKKLEEKINQIIAIGRQDTRKLLQSHYRDVASISRLFKKRKMLSGAIIRKTLR